MSIRLHLLSQTFCLLLFAFAAGCASRPVQRERPDQTVFKAVTQAMDDYRTASPNPFKLVSSLADGTLETDWHPVHKGEIELKIEATVVGKSYTVEAWQRSSWPLLKRPIKSDWSRRAESNIVERVTRILNVEKASQPKKPTGEIGRRESLRWRYFVTVTPEQIKAARNAQDSYPAEDDRDGKWGPNWEGLQLSIRLQKETFTNGEPVVACITLRNAGDKVQYFHTAEPRPEMDTKIFLIRDGKRILGVDDPKPGESPLQRLSHVRSGSSHTEPISSGTQRQFFRDLSKVFDLTVLGNYSAQAERTVIAADNLPDRPGYIRAVTSNLLSGTVTFRIGRDSQKNSGSIIILR